MWRTLLLVAGCRVPSAAPPEAPPAPPLRDIALLQAGSLCALDPDGALACRGAPIAIDAAQARGPYEQVVTGMGHVCARKADGEATCWGGGAFASVASPAQHFQTIASGMTQICGILDRGNLACWDARGLDVLEPPGGHFRTLGLGQYAACAIRDTGALTCWGGEGTRWRLSDGAEPSAVAVAIRSALVLLEDGRLEAIGAWSVTPPSGSFTAVAAASHHLCALSTAGDASCWSEMGGKILLERGPFSKISVGSAESCGLRPSGEAHCWKI